MNRQIQFQEHRMNESYIDPCHLIGRAQLFVNSIRKNNDIDCFYSHHCQEGGKLAELCKLMFISFIMSCDIALIMWNKCIITYYECNERCKNEFHPLYFILTWFEDFPISKNKCDTFYANIIAYIHFELGTIF